MKHKNLRLKHLGRRRPEGAQGSPAYYAESPHDPGAGGESVKDNKLIQ